MEDLAETGSSLLETKDTRYWPTFEETKKMIASVFPVVIGFLLETSTPLVSIGFLTDSEDVAALGLGSMWLNCVGNSLFFAIAAGFESLVAQANGAQDYKLCANYLHKAVALITVLFGGLVIFIYFSESILLMFGIEPNLAYYSAQYMRYSGLASYFAGLLWTVSSFMHAQGVFYVTLLASSISLGLHFVVTWLFTNICESKLIGTAIAKCFSDGINIAFIYFYTKWRGYCSQTLLPFELNFSLGDLVTFFKQAFPQGAIIYLEWFSFELFTFQASNLPNTNSIAVHVVATTILNMYYQFGEGLGIIITSYVGNALGARDKISAVRSSFTGISIMLGLNFLATIFFKVFEDGIIEFFFQDIEAQQLMSRVMIMFIIFIWVDGLQATISGILRGMGKANEALISYSISLYGIGQVLSLILTFVLDMDVIGIWLAMAIAIVIVISAMGVIIYRTDWDRQIEVIRQELMKNDENVGQSESEIEMIVRSK